MTLSSLNVSSASVAPAFVRLPNGEYSASSILASPIKAIQRGFTKQSDGNYGLFQAAPSSLGVASRVSSNVLSALNELTLGG